LYYRPRQSLDGVWSFSTTDPLSFDPSTQINVPSPWQADPQFRKHNGIAWYQREFDISSEWLQTDLVVILGFGAIDYFAEVWVNEKFVGSHEGGYLPFEFDITSFVMVGTNSVKVRVQDPLEIFSEIPHGKQSWYGMLSGIWQSVWIESRHATHIQKINITTVGYQLSVIVRLSNTLLERISADVIDPLGNIAAHIDSSALNFSIPIENPSQWSPDYPNLYTIKISVGEDTLTETFGFRTIQKQYGQLILNGKPIYLRAALDQDYYPDLICTPPSQEFIEDQLMKAKTLGFNCIRVHIKIADPRYYFAADKIGMLIWTELPNHVLLTDKSKNRVKETLIGMVDRDWNHPSIIIWTIINEAWGVDVSNPDHRLWLLKMYELMKTLDPFRLTVGNSPCWGNFNVASDLDDYHMYYGMPDHQRQWNEWVAEFAKRPWWTYACQYENEKNWKEYLSAPWKSKQRLPTKEVRRRGDEPLIVSEFGNWGLPDVHKLKEHYVGEPWWFESGFEWADGVVFPHGIEDRFDNYGLNKVFPSLQELSFVSQKMQFEALKYEIEQMRKQPNIQGYVVTELTDVHWECNGLLDMLRSPKKNFDQFSDINNDDVLAPIWERLVYSSTETGLIKFIFSHYSEFPVIDAKFNWEMMDSKSVIDSGYIENINCDSYQIIDIGEVGFLCPDVKNPTRISLMFNLKVEEKLIAQNHLEFIILPQNRHPQLIIKIYAPEINPVLINPDYKSVNEGSEADIIITSILDDTLRELLLSGEKILFLADHDDALKTYIPGLQITSRSGTPWQGDWASSFGWHTFNDIPTNHTVDFTFSDLTPNHVIHGFAARNFHTDVFAGIFVGWLHKPIPTIARLRVGKGELIITTFQIKQNLTTNPLARYLLQNLIELFHF
jgi:hypothetical protein